MKSLVAHILKKDFRHLWPWLALWWGLLALTDFYPAWAFARLMHAGLYYSDDVMPVMLIWLAWFVISLLIVGSLVETDSPINDRVLWRAWPVPPLRLLVSSLASSFSSRLTCKAPPLRCNSRRIWHHQPSG
ncbi:MAG: hypothetical protein ABSH19_08050 [Opitutales bacterium]